MDIIDNGASTDESVASRVAPRLLNLGNNLQYAEGTLDGFARTGLSKRKWSFERDFIAWVNADRERKENYGTVLDQLNVLHAESSGLEARNRIMSDLGRQSAMVRTSLLLYKLATESVKLTAGVHRGSTIEIVQKSKDNWTP